MKRKAPELPECVVHESFPKRRKQGTSNTILAGIAFRPFDNGACMIASVGEKTGLTYLPKPGCKPETALKFVEKLREQINGVVAATPKKKRA